MITSPDQTATAGVSTDDKISSVPIDATRIRPGRPAVLPNRFRGTTLLGNRMVQLMPHNEAGGRTYDTARFPDVVTQFGKSEPPEPFARPPPRRAITF